MYDLLVERGYRVDTQVLVGTKRINLVVEGADDSRVAIECGRDRYHGPEQWPDDMSRQRSSSEPIGRYGDALPALHARSSGCHRRACQRTRSARNRP
ncbi:hypothetical protein [Novosphingobium sp. 9]|uniref:hypothetical protein n=1 Tax=Novosphingobium sp. 9 TaxID=2025349 RepID=UPI0021B60E83|nr:hypothetical protein [Novosphingobium sp. 9]